MPISYTEANYISNRKYTRSGSSIFAFCLLLRGDLINLGLKAATISEAFVLSNLDSSQFAPDDI